MPYVMVASKENQCNPQQGDFLGNEAFILRNLDGMWRRVYVDSRRTPTLLVNAIVPYG